MNVLPEQDESEEQVSVGQASHRCEWPASVGIVTLADIAGGLTNIQPRLRSLPTSTSLPVARLPRILVVLCLRPSPSPRSRSWPAT